MISIFTWNVKMLPGSIGEGAKDLLRAKSVTEAIVDLDPDVVCLQEVFDEDIRDALVHYLSMTYGHFVSKGDMPWDVRQDSGLFVASKYPINSSRFVPFSSAAGVDMLAQKGVLGITLDVQGDPLYLLTSHLQASYGTQEEHDDVREAQLSKLAAVSSYHPYPTVMLGDMNVVAEEDTGDPTAEYLRMLRILNLRDLYREESEDSGYTVDPSNIMCTDSQASRMDYIFASQEVRCDRIAVMHMYDLSDHFALYAEIET
jgi:endonuclease/exonuclease/phosphatase family metal-dependent hydrolase